ncbi:hypothetical protein NMG60_11017449 [Bertholletia excelsa]
MASFTSKPLNPDAKVFKPSPSTEQFRLPQQISEHSQPVKPSPPAEWWLASYLPFHSRVYDISLQPQLDYAQLRPQYCWTFHGGCGYGYAAATVCREADDGKKHEFPKMKMNRVSTPRFVRGGFLGDRSKNCKRMWMPKSQRCKTPIPLITNTTVMIKNIPNKYRLATLLPPAVLCLCVLQPNSLTVEYDFLYLPMDFGSKDNLGYAFVNFTTASAAEKVRAVLQGYKWDDFTDSYGCRRYSRKICETSWAKIQGKDELEKHFKDSKFCCRNKEYLPVVFSPPRDGSACAEVMVITVGRCLPPCGSTSSTE